MVIDFHTYIGSDAYGDHTQTADELVAAMDTCGIDVAIVAPLLDTPGIAPGAHDRLYADCRRFPGRLIPFARLDPRYRQAAQEELNRAVGDLGCRGLLFDPVSTRSLPYHPLVLPLMEAAGRHNLPVLIPTGNAYLGLPEQVALLAERLPDLTIVMGHMGTAAHAVRAIELSARLPNLYLETSLQQSPYRLPLAIQEAGANKVLFGSGSPYSHPLPELRKIEVANLSPLDRSAVLRQNAARILGLEVKEDSQ
jgi:predicted TIM-barrel fold metal-dependent hydrolase